MADTIHTATLTESIPKNRPLATARYTRNGHGYRAITAGHLFCVERTKPPQASTATAVSMDAKSFMSMIRA